MATAFTEQSSNNPGVRPGLKVAAKTTLSPYGLRAQNWPPPSTTHARWLNGLPQWVLMNRFFLIALGVSFCGVWFATNADTAVSRRFHLQKQIIRTPDAPGQSPLYSQAIKVGGVIYVTGIPGVYPSTNQPAGSTIQEQPRQALTNCRTILRAAGAELENVVEVQVLLARPDDFAALNEAHAKFFPGDPPVRSVAKLGPELPNLLLSVRMVAVL